MNAQEGEIDVRTLAPMFGMPTKGVAEPDYLEYDIRGRGFLERMFFNCGSMYLVGMFGGGIYGAGAAYRSEASGASFRVITNSMMNGFGKRGANAGNAFGAIALLYSCYESIADSLQLHAFVQNHDAANPIFAGIATGFTYKAFAGPRAIVLAGALGGSLAASLHYFPSFR
uniref:Mitochondrial import inner membrane translocase subunit TIM22 n=1 Tax=Aureoumbra lagunensis TaxID=44058 RepID=A0A7S3JYG3_9STRA|mmetsp:Transcript_13221/g.17647  ORF Transcript_13221/g.17647 Transcript_13221/m.17647 type:complete len:171 (+) Transcript_13221:93-605(+)|eukprot:CAMPEP_0197288676 /NCGR_PEP_ID=MMETSP0890-20130614/5848_1 /TAXON_ID=44058 ORGANISM="Aureoumbra lagunensis, Strain CCMP1510" /NCGR_SAMPLE_ID=MMETSP0890 /ASSEMBLY_ACC=CAM_ASM_000533 /LENGTH=170 /DNA_ID=CAMNT_0042759593 /DNA_START=67 /DNA_END=579 /DNA_ORIENTATION=-